MNRSKLITLTVLLAATVSLLLYGCGGGDRETASMDNASSITIVSDPDVYGWMDLSLSQASPIEAATGENTIWLLFDGGNLLRFSTGEGKWKSFILDGIGNVLDFDLYGDSPVMLTEEGLYVFDVSDGEMISEEIPEDFRPMDVAVDGDEIAVLDVSGAVAVLNKDGIEVYEPSIEVNPAGFLTKVGPDWVYGEKDGNLVFFDPTVSLWQKEESPRFDILVSASDVVFLGRNDSVFVRTAPGEWEYHAEGRLYENGLILAEEGISSVLAPGRIVAEPPAFEPDVLMAMKPFETPLWAVDELGMTVYSRIGMVETELPYYDSQRVACSVAGQDDGGMQGDPGSISDMLQMGGGTFRIYESVSVRPDPFTEFSSHTRDARRDIETISVEEFRLVGITLDPVGGDQAMVEDGLGVPYVLYEGTVLANNSHVAEITSNEVIVIQDVIVDYSTRGGGETTIPTIYSLRLHEEGGL